MLKKFILTYIQKIHVDAQNVPYQCLKSKNCTYNKLYKFFFGLFNRNTSNYRGPNYTSSNYCLFMNNTYFT